MADACSEIADTRRAGYGGGVMYLHQVAPATLAPTSLISNTTPHGVPSATLLPRSTTDPRPVSSFVNSDFGHVNGGPFREDFARVTSFDAQDERLPAQTAGACGMSGDGNDTLKKIVADPGASSMDLAYLSKVPQHSYWPPPPAAPAPATLKKRFSSGADNAGVSTSAANPGKPFPRGESVSTGKDGSRSYGPMLPESPAAKLTTIPDQPLPRTPSGSLAATPGPRSSSSQVWAGAPASSTPPAAPCSSRSSAMRQPGPLQTAATDTRSTNPPPTAAAGPAAASGRGVNGGRAPAVALAPNGGSKQQLPLGAPIAPQQPLATAAVGAVGASRGGGPPSEAMQASLSASQPQPRTQPQPRRTKEGQRDVQERWRQIQQAATESAGGAGLPVATAPPATSHPSPHGLARGAATLPASAALAPGSGAVRSKGVLSPKVPIIMPRQFAERVMDPATILKHGVTVLVRRIGDLPATSDPLHPHPHPHPDATPSAAASAGVDGGAAGGGEGEDAGCAPDLVMPTRVEQFFHAQGYSQYRVLGLKEISCGYPNWRIEMWEALDDTTVRLTIRAPTQAAKAAVPPPQPPPPPPQHPSATAAGNPAAAASPSRNQAAGAGAGAVAAMPPRSAAAAIPAISSAGEASPLARRMPLVPMSPTRAPGGRCAFPAVAPGGFPGAEEGPGRDRLGGLGDAAAALLEMDTAKRDAGLECTEVVGEEDAEDAGAAATVAADPDEDREDRPMGPAPAAASGRGGGRIVKQEIEGLHERREERPADGAAVAGADAVAGGRSVGTAAGDAQSVRGRGSAGGAHMAGGGAGGAVRPPEEGSLAAAGAAVEGSGGKRAWEPAAEGGWEGREEAPGPRGHEGHRDGGLSKFMRTSGGKAYRGGDGGFAEGSPTVGGQQDHVGQQAGSPRAPPERPHRRGARAGGAGGGGSSRDAAGAGAGGSSTGTGGGGGGGGAFGGYSSLPPEDMPPELPGALATSPHPCRKGGATVLSPEHFIHLPRLFFQDHFDTAAVLAGGLRVQVQAGGVLDPQVAACSVASYQNHTGYRYYRLLGFKEVPRRYAGWRVAAWDKVAADTVRVRLAPPLGLPLAAALSRAGLLPGGPEGAQAEAAAAAAGEDAGSGGGCVVDQLGGQQQQQQRAAAGGTLAATATGGEAGGGGGGRRSVRPAADMSRRGCVAAHEAEAADCVGQHEDMDEGELSPAAILPSPRGRDDAYVRTDKPAIVPPPVKRTREEQQDDASFHAPERRRDGSPSSPPAGATAPSSADLRRLVALAGAASRGPHDHSGNHQSAPVDHRLTHLREIRAPAPTRNAASISPLYGNGSPSPLSGSGGGGGGGNVVFRHQGVPGVTEVRRIMEAGVAAAAQRLGGAGVARVRSVVSQNPSVVRPDKGRVYLQKPFVEGSLAVGSTPLAVQVLINSGGQLDPGMYPTKVTLSSSGAHGKAEYLLRLTAPMKQAHTGQLIVGWTALGRQQLLMHLTPPPPPHGQPGGGGGMAEAGMSVPVVGLWPAVETPLMGREGSGGVAQREGVDEELEEEEEQAALGCGGGPDDEAAVGEEVHAARPQPNRRGCAEGPLPSLSHPPAAVLRGPLCDPLLAERLQQHHEALLSRALSALCRQPATYQAPLQQQMRHAGAGPAAADWPERDNDGDVSPPAGAALLAARRPRSLGVQRPRQSCWEHPSCSLALLQTYRMGFVASDGGAGCDGGGYGIIAGGGGGVRGGRHVRKHSLPESVLHAAEQLLHLSGQALSASVEQGGDGEEGGEEEGEEYGSKEYGGLHGLSYVAGGGKAEVALPVVMPGRGGSEACADAAEAMAAVEGGGTSGGGGADCWQFRERRAAALAAMRGGGGGGGSMTVAAAPQLDPPLVAAGGGVSEGAEAALSPFATLLSQAVGGAGQHAGAAVLQAGLSPVLPRCEGAVAARLPSAKASAALQEAEAAGPAAASIRAAAAPAAAVLLPGGPQRLSYARSSIDSSGGLQLPSERPQLPAPAASPPEGGSPPPPSPGSGGGALEAGPWSPYREEVGRLPRGASLGMARKRSAASALTGASGEEGDGGRSVGGDSSGGDGGGEGSRPRKSRRTCHSPSPAPGVAPAGGGGAAGEQGSLEQGSRHGAGVEDATAAAAIRDPAAAAAYLAGMWPFAAAALPGPHMQTQMQAPTSLPPSALAALGAQLGLHPSMDVIARIQELRQQADQQQQREALQRQEQRQRWKQWQHDNQESAAEVSTEVPHHRRSSAAGHANTGQKGGPQRESGTTLSTPPRSVADSLDPHMQGPLRSSSATLGRPAAAVQPVPSQPQRASSDGGACGDRPGWQSLAGPGSSRRGQGRSRPDGESAHDTAATGAAEAVRLDAARLVRQGGLVDAPWPLSWPSLPPGALASVDPALLEHYLRSGGGVAAAALASSSYQPHHIQHQHHHQPPQQYGNGSLGLSGVGPALLHLMMQSRLRQQAAELAAAVSATATAAVAPPQYSRGPLADAGAGQGVGEGSLGRW
ncbi:hypothetical protein Agub_g4690 [Astrephomene gubernaculifera]|uniref:Uncharacterized protein n=1 Tax=Astrephomene gubernaculifera TaxID=47775 RepID=A0AAD3HK33_9CHLO|nr:hypothetical protein Agub_g4690 [Astrephomene gubernaculifera]